MSYSLAFYCKTYNKDFDRVRRLLQSVEQFNEDNIPLFISTPATEYDMLKDAIGTQNYTYIADEDICQLESPFFGWKSQVPLKLNAYTKIDAKNLLVIDSDAFFIKKFYLTDFIAYDNIPYTQICENKHLAELRQVLKGSSYVESEYSKCAMAYRDVFGGRSNKIYDYGPNPHLWSTDVLRHMVTHYLEPNNLDFQSLSTKIEQLNPGIHSRESTTYGEYLLATKCIDIIPTGPFFKVYHWKEQYDFEKGTGLDLIENIRHNYLGIILQSNWSII